MGTEAPRRPRERPSKDDGRERPFVITVDGPAGSGKSTTAREVARRLGFYHLDSGALYRGITLALLRASDGVLNPEAIDGSRIEALDLQVSWDDEGPLIRLDGAPVPDDDLRARPVTEVVSAVAAVPSVRRWLMEAQRSGARLPGLVADGRDMGSVVFPEAQVKVFLQADTKVRAARRLQQLGTASPTPAEVTREADRLRARDASDAGREVAPLIVPDGAYVIDTTEVEFEEQVEEILALVGRAQPGD
ncbi:MAG: (d)CMP kinase [Gemmatimonadetes bacterium]|nr:(d)CMP kinase [Gemmatimonadota bacterium]